jgi:hypothetical protein
MKHEKIVAALFAASLLIGGGRELYALASDHSGELNLKGGMILNGKGSNIILKTKDSSSESKSSIDDFENGQYFVLEYLIPCSHFFQDQDKDLFKFGLGLGYLFHITPKKLDIPINWFIACSHIYFTLQVNPFPSQYELLHRLFIKGNIGYSFNVSSDKSILKPYVDTILKKPTGGIYYGLSAGYEFPVGIIIDLAYCVCKFGSEYKCSIHDNGKKVDMEIDYTAQVITLTIGYKFKI